MDVHTIALLLRVLSFSVAFPVFSLVRLPFTIRIATAVCLAIVLLPIAGPQQFYASIQVAERLESTLIASPELLVLECGVGVFIAVICGVVILSLQVFSGWIAAFANMAHMSGDGQCREDSTLQLGISLLGALAILYGVGFERLLAPLLESVRVVPLASVETKDWEQLLSLGVSIGAPALRFSALLALPFALVAILTDVLTLVLQRVYRPFVQGPFAEVVRASAVFLLLSLGILYVEYSSVEMANQWASDATTTLSKTQ